MVASVINAERLRETSVIVQPVTEPRQPRVSTGRSLILSVGGVTAILLFCKVVGFSEKLVIAHYLGTSGEADAYYVAFALVWTCVFVARELTQPVFVPVYMEVLHSDREHARRLFTLTLLTIALLGAACALVFAFWPQWLASVTAPGFDEPARLRVSQFLGSMSIGVGLLVTMSATYALLNAHRAFYWAAAGDLLFRVTLVGGILAGFFFLHGNRVGTALAAGGAIALIVHMIVACKYGSPCIPRVDEATRASVHRMLLLASPLLVGVLSSNVGQLIGGMLASALPAGSVSALAYARKLTDAIVLLGPVALTTILFATFSSLAAQGRIKEIRRQLVRCARIVLAVSTPIALLVICLREPLVRVLFQHGRFSAQSTELTSVALAGYGVGLVALALDGLVVSTFYAMKDMRTPVILGLLGVVLEMCMAWSLMGSLGHLAIALAASVSKIVKVAALWWILSVRLGTATSGVDDGQ